MTSSVRSDGVATLLFVAEGVMLNLFAVVAERCRDLGPVEENEHEISPEMDAAINHTNHIKKSSNCLVIYRT